MLNSREIETEIISDSTQHLRGKAIMTEIFGGNLDAAYSTEVLNDIPTIVLESHGGRTREGGKRNSEYSKRLFFILQALSDKQLVIADIQVESTQTRKLTDEECRVEMVGYPYPINVSSVGSLESLRVAIANNQRQAGVPGPRKPGGRKSGALKRIRMYLQAEQNPTSLLETEWKPVTSAPVERTGANPLPLSAKQERPLNVDGRILWKKVWGFEPEYAPVIGWPEKAGVQNFLGKSDPDSWMLLTATGSKNALVEEQYRALGMAKVYRQVVDTKAVLDRAGYNSPSEDFNPDGSYRWPYGLIIREAVLFPDKPLVVDVLGTSGSISEASWVRELTAEQVEAVRALHVEPANVLRVRELENSTHTLREDALAYDRQHNTAQTGPPPSDYREASALDPDRETYVYRLRLHNRNAHFTDKPVFKIGYSHDPVGRCATLNDGLVSHITKCHWELETSFLCRTARQAFALEQEIHAATMRKRVLGTREVVQMDEAELESIWRKAITDAEWLSAPLNTP